MVDDAVPYPRRVGGRLPVGVGERGAVLGVDPEENLLVAGDVGAGCSTMLRVVAEGALDAGLAVTVVDGTAPSYFRDGTPRHDFDAARDRLLQYEDGTIQPATVMKEIIAGARPRPDLLILDDAFDLEHEPPEVVLGLYADLREHGVAVATRVMNARLGTRDSYGTRILLGHASPMRRQLALGVPDGPPVRRTDPPGTGVIHYSDGSLHRFRGYWLEPVGAPEAAAQGQDEVVAPDGAQAS